MLQLVDKFLDIIMMILFWLEILNCMTDLLLTRLMLIVYLLMMLQISLENKLWELLQKDLTKYILEEEELHLRQMSLLLQLLLNTMLEIITWALVNFVFLDLIILIMAQLLQLFLAVQMKPTLLVFQHSHGQRLNSHN